MAFLYIGCSGDPSFYFESLWDIHRWAVVSDVTKGRKMVTVAFPSSLSCSALAGGGAEGPEREDV